jgi:hypothetical protein
VKASDESLFARVAYLQTHPAALTVWVGEQIRVNRESNKTPEKK